MKALRILFRMSLIAVLAASCSSVSYNRQRIKLEGVSNARQLGGYRIGDKRVVKDVLLRTANLADATDKDIAILHDEYALYSIFDFRSTLEVSKAPDRMIPGSEYMNLPCLEAFIAKFASGNVSGNLRHAGSDKFSSESLEIFKSEKVKVFADSLYQFIVFDTIAQNHFAAFLDSLEVLPSGRSVLWHCSQGKDRTGWSAAFLLAALGADRDLLVKDFALSNHGYRFKIKAAEIYAKKQGMSQEQINMISALLGVSVQNFEKTLDMIDQKYGSLDNYLERALRCDESQRLRLRERFLE